MTDTEEFWKGEFGDEYSARNLGLIQNNIQFFDNILIKTGCYEEIRSIIEFGAGTGQNIEALHMLWPYFNFTSVEINEVAASHIKRGMVYRGSIFDFKEAVPPSDLALTKGFLIHIPPDKLKKAYDIIYKSSGKYILICEYYNPVPVEVSYRGHEGKLWKRDFAGEMLDIYPRLKLVDYGFTYHRDKYPQDDLTWFLLEKQNVTR